MQKSETQNLQDPKHSKHQHDAYSQKFYGQLHAMGPHQHSNLLKILYNLIFTLLCKADMKQMNFMLRHGSLPNKPHYINASIPKSKMYLKSETLFMPNILGKQCLSCNNKNSFLKVLVVLYHWQMWKSISVTLCTAADPNAYWEGNHKLWQIHMVLSTQHWGSTRNCLNIKKECPLQ